MTLYICVRFYVYTTGSSAYRFNIYEKCRGCDRMVVGFTTTYASSAYHHYTNVEFESRSSEVYSIQLYVIKFVSDLRQVGVLSGYSGFLNQ